MGFLDGSRLYDVRSYASVRETWREWGRSLDLKDASTTWRQWGDVLFLLLVQGMPLPALVTLGALWVAGESLGDTAKLVGLVSGILVLVRVLLQRALAASYARRGLAFWLSPTADPLAAVRIVVSTVRRPKAWRGRAYSKLGKVGV